MKFNNIIVKTREGCSICGYGNLVSILDLPNLPLTGFFSNKKQSLPVQGVNQKLLWCPKCGQGQLLHQVNPVILYDSDKYTFRTSASASAKEGTNFLLNFLKSLIGKKILNYGIDVGCNDLYLLNEAASFIRKRLGIDPIWNQKNTGNLSDGTRVLGKTIEDVEFEKDIISKPDIVFCRHAIEHIFEPEIVIRKLMEFADEDTIFIFETPCFETLIERYRFDQVFHEHLQYFSLASFECILSMSGAEIISWTKNYHNWGAMVVAFKKSRSKKRIFKFNYQKNEIRERVSIFHKQMDNVMQLLKKLSNSGIYGYGAAMMLPILGYHLGTDFTFLKALLDDDVKKDGKYYVNLPVQICYSGKIKNDVLSNSNVFITAVDNVKPIMTKLLSIRPKNIIYPFHNI